MDPLITVHKKQTRNVDLVRQRSIVSIAHGLNLAPCVDLRPWMTDIEDQGDMASCVANAIAG
jgi:hypothetical protein